MKPTVIKFQNDTKLIEEVKKLAAQGISKGDLYVMLHDDDRTDRVADKVDASKVGISEEGLGNALANIFRKKGDELRSQFQELGFSQGVAEELEDKLDHGEILLLIKQ